MYCTNCGFDNLPEARFCEECGAPIVSETPDLGNSYSSDMGGYTPAPKKKGFAPAFIAIAVAAVAVVICYFLGVFKPGYEKAMDKYVKAMNKGDFETIYELGADPHYKEIMDKRGNTKSFVIEKLEETFELDKKKYGDDIKYSCKITDKKDYDKKDVKKINEYLEEKKGYPADYLDDIVVVEIETSVKGSKDEYTQDQETNIIKVDGKWYINSILTKEKIDDILDD